MSTAIELLRQKWQDTLNEKNTMIEKYDAKLAELDQAIEVLCGNKINDKSQTSYDDENPDYIKGTEDGI